MIRGDTVHGTYAESQQVFDDLAAVGIDLDDVFEVLETEGVDKFDKSWAELLQTVEQALADAKPETRSAAQSDSKTGN